MAKADKIPRILEDLDLHLPLPEAGRLDNGIPYYCINKGSQEVLKLEIVFKAGRPYEKKKVAAGATTRLLREGTSSRTGAQIAETVDYYGATLSCPFTLDLGGVVLYCLNKHFQTLLPIVREVLTEPAFPEKELRAFKDNARQKLKVDLTKTDVVAFRQVTEHIFGTSHPYGYNSGFDTIEAISREDLVQHHRQAFVAGNCVVVISGRLQKDTLALLNEYLGGPIPAGSLSPQTFPPLPDQQEKVFHSHPGALQSAIRIGRRLFRRNHPDYPVFFILHIILGGYFGSRLMVNIREDKGYTYNIFSSLDPLLYDGIFYVGTEVGSQYVGDTLEEIYKEMDLLKRRPVPAEELKMVRNYLLGNLLHMLDGPFNVAAVIKSYAMKGLPFDTFDHMVETIRSVEPRQLQQMAEKYFDREQFWEVVAGPAR